MSGSCWLCLEPVPGRICLTCYSLRYVRCADIAGKPAIRRRHPDVLKYGRNAL